MKIRSGFVSNSSSSSFIVVFDEAPKSASHLKDMMFPKTNTIEYFDSNASHKVSLLTDVLTPYSFIFL